MSRFWTIFNLFLWVKISISDLFETNPDISKNLFQTFNLRTKVLKILVSNFRICVCVKHGKISPLYMSMVSKAAVEWNIVSVCLLVSRSSCRFDFWADRLKNDLWSLTEKNSVIMPKNRLSTNLWRHFYGDAQYTRVGPSQKFNFAPEWKSAPRSRWMNNFFKKVATEKSKRVMQNQWMR